jgi:hypothetical protein
MEVSRKTRALLMRLIVDFEDQRTDSVRFSREGTTLVVPRAPADTFFTAFERLHYFMAACAGGHDFSRAVGAEGQRGFSLCGLIIGS